MSAATLAPLPVIVPLVGAALLLGGSRWLPRLAIDLLALATSAAALVCCILLALASRDAPIVYWFAGWAPHGGTAVGISFYIDPAAAAVAALACVLMTGALVFSTRYFEAFEGRFHALMLVFLASLVGFALTLDLFNLFVWFELMGVSAYALTGYRTEEAAALQGGINFAITNTVGSFASLLGLALLYGTTGALNLAQIGRALAAHPAGPPVAIGCALVCTGLLVKAAIVPFHFWLADAHAVAPTPVCTLFSGVMVELGVYAIARIYWVAFARTGIGHALTPVLVGAGLATILVGSVMCFLQRHVKRLLAFSTIAHAGIVLVAIGLRDTGALAGALAYIAAHGVTKAALFLCAGILMHRFGSVNELALFGAGRRLRGTFVIYLAAAASLAGVPPFGTCHALALIDAGLRAHGDGWIVPILAFGTIVTTAAVLRAGFRVFLGWGQPPRATRAGDRADVPGPETYGPRGRVPVLLWAPALALVAIAAVLGSGFDAWRTQAAHFASPLRYARDVLDAATAAAPAPVPADVALGHAWIIAIVGSVALALAATFAGHRLPPGPLARGLRRLHRGDIGAYTTWLLVGLAALCAAFAWLT